ncbi:hypothetical protein KQH56_01110 [bacterium]|nr:hypothetical protein [bacterium]
MSTFALLGLFMIFSMLVTSTVEAQTLGEGQVTETLAIASPDFTDTVGDGLPSQTEEASPTPNGGTELPGGEETPTNMPTEDSTEDPEAEETQDQTETQASEETEEVTETQSPEETATEDPEKTETDPSETSEPTGDVTETPSPEPGETDEPESSETATSDPEETEEVGEETGTPEATETEEPTEDPEQLAIELYGAPDRTAGGQQTCPGNWPWVKVDYSGNHITENFNVSNLGGNNYNGYAVAKICYKAGTEIKTYDVNPPVTSGSVSSTIWNKWWCEYNPGANGCNYKEISHISYMLVEVQEPEKPLSLESDCVEDGAHAGDHIWTVTNQNNFAIDYNWYSNKDGQGGSRSVNANSTDTFYTNSKDQTVTISYNYPDPGDRCGGGCNPDPITLSVHADVCVIDQKVELDLDYVCEDDGDHYWTVTNQNSFPIDFSWESNVGGQQGQGTVIGNSTANFTTNSAAQTVTMTYFFPDNGRCGTGRCVGPEPIVKVVQAEVCKINMDDLILSVDCLPDGSHKWTVANSNGFAVDFDWSTTDGSSGSGTAPAGSFTTFNSGSAAQTATITYSDNVETKEASLYDDACPVPLEKLNFSVICLDNGLHQWKVSNPNNEPLDFSWSSTTGETGTGTAPATSFVTFTTAIGWQRVSFRYMLNGHEEEKTKTANECDAPSVNLQFVCGYPDDQVFTWKVVNNNNFSVNFNWSVHGTSESGTGSVAANSSTTFTTSTGKKKVKLYVMGQKVDQEWSSDPCKLDLVLDYRCDDDGSMKWSVYNPNNYEQSFTWSSTNGQTGSGSVKGGKTAYFTTNNDDQTVTVTYQTGDFPSRSIYKDAERCTVPLSVDPVCGYPGDDVYYWKVTNPNNFSVDYSWMGGIFVPFEFGSGTASPGTSYFSTSTSISWVKVGGDWAFVTDPCMVDLTIDYDCEDDGSHTWTVTNTNDFAQSFSWSSTSGESGSGSVAANSTETFSTDKTAQTVTVKYTNSPFPERSIFLAAEACKVQMDDLILDNECLEDGSHRWTVTNNNNFEKDFSWSSTSGETGSDTVPANDSVTFDTDHTAQTMTVTYNHEGQEIEVTNDAEVCLLKPTITVKCLPNGDHEWTLTNNNDFELPFVWSSTSSEEGIGTMPANGTRSFTSDHSSQTVTVKYQYNNEELTLTKSDEACQAPALSLDYICGFPSDTYLKWKITNNNNFAVSYSWIVDGDSESGSGTIGANTSIYFNSSLGNKTIKLYVLDQMVAQKDGGETCYDDLIIDVECLENGDHQWTVSNTNDFDMSFTWSSTTGDSGSDTVSANDSVNITTGIDAQTLTVTYEYGLLPERSITSDAEVCDAPDLLLTYICGYPSDTELIWRVRNSHDFDVPFTWDVYGTSENGSGVASANSDTFFTTSLGNKTVRLFVYNQLVNTKAGGSVCKVDLELDFQCTVTGLHEWTVTNGNDFEQAFDWSSTNGESGSGIAPANGSVSFITALELQTVTITYQNYVHPEKTVEVIAEACKSPELDLVYDCGYPTDSVLYWYVSNPLDVDIDFDWEVVGDTEKGSGTATANADTYFTTSTGTKSVKIMVEGYDIDVEDGGESCMVELSLSFNCLDNGTQEWTVTNLNKDDQPFSWSSDSGANGSGTVPADGSFKFSTANIEQEITINYKHDPFPAQSTVAFGEVCKLSTPEPPTTYGISSDVGTCQEWIVFHTMRDGNMEVYRLDGIEGVGDFALFNLSNGDGIDARPSRSFNDTWVAFQSNRDGNYEIYYGDTAGSQQYKLTDNEADDINPMFSPDNTHIVFQSNRDGNWDLYMVNRVTGEETQLTNAESDEINPFFSNNQNFLVFETNKNGNQDIYLLNIVTGDEYKVATSEADELSPALSPNGQKVAFLSPVDGVMQLFVIDIDGSNKTQITDGDGDTNHHSWSPDSTRLAYQSFREDNLDVYSYDLRDNTEYRVTEGPVDDIGPTWDCGGVNLSFTSTSASDDLNIYQVYWKGGASSQMTIDPSTDQWSEWSPAKETASRDD